MWKVLTQGWKEITPLSIPPAPLPEEWSGRTDEKEVQMHRRVLEEGLTMYRLSLPSSSSSSSLSPSWTWSGGNGGSGSGSARFARRSGHCDLLCWVTSKSLSDLTLPLNVEELATKGQESSPSGLYGESGALPAATRKQDHDFQEELGLANSARGGFCKMLTNALGAVAEVIAAFAPMALTPPDLDISDSKSDSFRTDIAFIEKEPSPKRSQRHLTQQDSISGSQTTQPLSSPPSIRSTISSRSSSISVSRETTLTPFPQPQPPSPALRP